MSEDVTPGPGQDIRRYSDEQVIDRLVRIAEQQGSVDQMGRELARRATGREGD